MKWSKFGIFLLRLICSITSLSNWAKSFGRKTICARFDQTAISMESFGYRLPREFQQCWWFLWRVYNREMLRMSEFIRRNYQQIVVLGQIRTLNYYSGFILAGRARAVVLGVKCRLEKQWRRLKNTIFSLCSSLEEHKRHNNIPRRNNEGVCHGENTFFSFFIFAGT